MGKQSIIKIALAAIALVGLAHCGGKKSKSDGVKVNIVPGKPTVISASIPGDGSRIKPWFDFRVELTNDTDQAFKIVAIEAEITGQDSSGSNTTQTVAWAASQLDYSNDIAGIQCAYADFGTWQPGATMELLGSGAGSSCAVFTQITLPAGNNPTGVTGKNYRYKVKLKPLGYFIDANGDADDRLDKFKYFFTQ